MTLAATSLLPDAVRAAAWSPSNRLVAIAADGTVVLDGDYCMPASSGASLVGVTWIGSDTFAVGDRSGCVMLVGPTRIEQWCASPLRGLVPVRENATAVGGQWLFPIPNPNGFAPIDPRVGSVYSAAAICGSMVVAGGSRGVALVDTRLGIVDTRIDIAAVVAVASNRAATHVAAGTLGGSLHVIKLGRESEGIELAGYPDRVQLVEWSASGRWLAAAADDEITWWAIDEDGDPGAAPVSTIEHRSPITALAPAPNEALVASGDAAGRVQLWSTTTRAKPIGRQLALPSEITVLAWSRDSRWLAAGSRCGRLIVWRLGWTADPIAN